MLMESAIASLKRISAMGWNLRSWPVALVTFVSKANQSVVNSEYGPYIVAAGIVDDKIPLSNHWFLSATEYISSGETSISVAFPASRSSNLVVKLGT